MFRHKLLIAPLLAAVISMVACEPTAEQTIPQKAGLTTDQKSQPVPPQDAASSDPQNSDVQTSDTVQETKTDSVNYFNIQTELGDLVVRLYDETPAHRDNFRKLVEENFYDGTRFHRVIEGFMVQGGDPNSKDDDPSNDGLGGPGYTVEAEFNPTLLHKRGALAAARQPDQVNPQQRSSGSQFYIVHGRLWSEQELDQIEAGVANVVPGFAYSDSVRTSYMTDGGAPFLDMQYSVFGEVVEGFDVLDAIARTKTGFQDRPETPITMQVQALPDYSPSAAQ